MQTERITLPEHPDQPGVEQWAEIRHVSTLRAGDAKAIRKAMRFQLEKDGTSWDRSFSAGDGDDRVDALLVRVVTGWSYPLPLPVADRASLDELPVDAWSALKDATEGHLEALDFDRKPPPQSPPEGSSDSRTTSAGSGSPDTEPTTT